MTILKIRRGQQGAVNEGPQSYSNAPKNAQNKSQVTRAAEQLMDFDPYDVFLLPDKRAQSRLDWIMRVTAITLFIIMLIGGGYSLFQGVFSLSGGDRHERPFAYFEIKAIDSVGHPVVGALVEGDEKYGVTDSFGEWRRFMRVELGSTFRIKITKKTRDGLLVADKNIAIPPDLPESGDLEIRRTISVDSRRPDLPMAAVEKVVPKQRPVPEHQEKTPPANDVAAVDGIKEIPRFDKVWFEVIPAVNSSGDPSSFLEEKVVQALKERVVQLGLRLDPGSGWVIRLQHLSAKGKTPQEGLIRVQSKLVGTDGSGDFNFLRNYKETAMETARGILWAASLHTDNSFKVRPYGERWVAESISGANLWREAAGTILVSNEKEFYELDKIAPVQGGGLLLKESSTPPCGAKSTCYLKRAGLDHRPPHQSWTSLHLKLLGNLSPELEIYVSGFQARPIAPGSYVYWGEKMGSANVTVVQNGAVVHRGRLKAKTDGPTRMILGQSTISKK